MLKDNRIAPHEPTLHPSKLGPLGEWVEEVGSPVGVIGHSSTGHSRRSPPYNRTTTKSTTKKNGEVGMCAGKEVVGVKEIWSGMEKHGRGNTKMRAAFA
jgi:hypothetical protein